MLPRAFKDLFRHHPAGVAVITFRGPDGAPVGFTATSVISVSAEPPVLVFSVARTSASWAALQGATSGIVHLLTPQDTELAARFARTGIDRFSGVAWEPLPTGEPLLDGVAAWARFNVAALVPAGASSLVLGEVTEISDAGSQPSQPERLVYVDRSYRTLAE